GFPASRVISLGPVKQRSTSPGKAVPGLDRTQYHFGVQKRQDSFRMGRESNPDGGCHRRPVLTLGLPRPDSIAKVLVEMELDREFPKIIALDDKQGNIFLVNVEYTWIPSMCERCGNLGHKAKRCLLTSKPVHDTTLQAQTKEDSCDIPVVDIDVILQNGNASTTPSPPVHPQVNANLVTSTAASDTLVIQNQNLSNDLDDQALILPSQQPDV
ncbi:hypothetical protein HID58_068660, partial [Brassica napus]